MTDKDFFLKSTVAVIGSGNWGTVLANLVSHNSAEVRLLVRQEESARAINSTRSNPKHQVGMELDEKIHAYHEPERAFNCDGGGVQAVIWALPSRICRQEARGLARYFQGHEILLHATKGVEQGSLKRISEVLSEELPLRRIGVISGPNLADEIARKEPAATVVASRFEEVCQSGQTLLTTEHFKVYTTTDVVGVEWAGALKNIFAIALGALDAIHLGQNVRAMLVSQGLDEMMRFGRSMGADSATFMGFAGIGDVLATSNSGVSRNYRAGKALAEGKNLEQMMSEVESTVEGVQTALSVAEYAHAHCIDMPVTDCVCQLILGQKTIQESLNDLMVRDLLAMPEPRSLPES